VTRTQKPLLGSITDPRGIVVHEVVMSIYAQGDDATWRGLLEKLGAHIEELSDQEWNATFTALPREPEKGGHFLSGEAHMALSDPTRAHWILELQKLPDSAPPKLVLESSQRVGGYPDVLANIASLWPPAATHSSEITVKYVLPADRWRSRLGSDERFQAAKVGGVSARPASIAWQIEPRSGIVSWIVEAVQPRSEARVVTARGSWTAPIQGNFVEAAEGQAWTGLAPFLEQVKR
jgi:hypothetical protein